MLSSKQYCIQLTEATAELIHKPIILKPGRDFGNEGNVLYHPDLPESFLDDDLALGFEHQLCHIRAGSSGMLHRTFADSEAGKQPRSKRVLFRDVLGCFIAVLECYRVDILMQNHAGYFSRMSAIRKELIGLDATTWSRVPEDQEGLLRLASDLAKKWVGTAEELPFGESVVLPLGDCLAKTAEYRENKKDYLQALMSEDWVKFELTDSPTKKVAAPIVPHQINLDPEEIGASDLVRRECLKVLGNSCHRLQDSGSSVDIPALIRLCVKGDDTRVFSQDARRPGFRAVVLVDRSGSMTTEKYTAAVKTCRILKRAFRGIVSMEFGYFCQDVGKDITVELYHPDEESFALPVPIRLSATPTWAALDFAVHRLRGAGEKYIFLITDGLPLAEGVSKEDARSAVRKAVNRATLDRITVVPILIGEAITKAGPNNTKIPAIRFDVRAEHMTFMFGPHWECSDPSRLANLVTSSVVKSFKKISHI